MKKLILTAMTIGLLAVSAPAFAQLAGGSMQDGPYTSAATASSHRGGMRMRREWRRHHHRYHRRHWAH